MVLGKCRRFYCIYGDTGETRNQYPYRHLYVLTKSISIHMYIPMQKFSRVTGHLCCPHRSIGCAAARGCSPKLPCATGSQPNPNCFSPAFWAKNAGKRIFWTRCKIRVDQTESRGLPQAESLGMFSSQWSQVGRYLLGRRSNCGVFSGIVRVSNGGGKHQHLAWPMWKNRGKVGFWVTFLTRTYFGNTHTLISEYGSAHVQVFEEKHDSMQCTNRLSLEFSTEFCGGNRVGGHGQHQGQRHDARL